jgi:hypothetical protein
MQVFIRVSCRPGFAFNAFSNDAYLEGLADCVEQGLTKAVGVSNFNAQRVKNAAQALTRRGTCLSSNQVWPGCACSLAAHQLHVIGMLRSDCQSTVDWLGLLLWFKVEQAMCTGVATCAACALTDASVW